MNPTLCQIPGCRIRGRHLPGCDDDDCRGCLPRLATEGLICETHERWAAQHLAEIERLTPDARLVAAGQVRRGHGGTGGKPGSRSPANDDAIDVMDAIQNALTTMARAIAEERGLQIALAGTTHPDPLVRTCRWLSGQLSWLRHATHLNGEPVAADVFREIGDCAARMRGLVDGPREQKYLGPCGAPTVEDHSVFDGEREWTDLREGPPCEGDVYGVAGAQTGRCRTCKTEYQQADRQDWIDTVRRDWLYHASEIAEAYPEIKANTVRKWYERGLLASHGEHKGGPLFLVGEVLDLAAADTARREEIRAERDRRKTAEMGT